MVDIAGGRIVVRPPVEIVIRPEEEAEAGLVPAPPRALPRRHEGEPAQRRGAGGDAASVLGAGAAAMSWRAVPITLFPEMFPGPLGFSLAGRALKEGIWSCAPIDLRAFGIGRHRSVDDAPLAAAPAWCCGRMWWMRLVPPPRRICR